VDFEAAAEEYAAASWGVEEVEVEASSRDQEGSLRVLVLPEVAVEEEVALLEVVVGLGIEGVVIPREVVMNKDKGEGEDLTV